MPIAPRTVRVKALEAEHTVILEDARIAPTIGVLVGPRTIYIRVPLATGAVDLAARLPLRDRALERQRPRDRIAVGWCFVCHTRRVRCDTRKDRRGRERLAVVRGRHRRGLR